MIVKNRAGAVDEFYVVDFGWMFGTPRIPTLPYCEFTDNYMWNVFGGIIKNADISHANHCNSEYMFWSWNDVSLWKKILDVSFT